MTAHNIFKSLAVLSEFFIFLYIGMGFVIGAFLTFQPLFFLLCTSVCLLSRVFNIYPLSFLANLFRTRAIPLKMQSVMWFAGLRGAISFALVGRTDYRLVNPKFILIRNVIFKWSNLYFPFIFLLFYILCIYYYNY